MVGLARRLPPEPDPRAEWHALDVAEDDLVPVLSGADVVVGPGRVLEVVRALVPGVRGAG